MKFLPKLNFHLKNPLKKMSKKKKILLAAILLLLIAVIAVIVSRSFKKNKMRQNMESVFTTETAVIERQTLTNSISATGTIQSAETKTVNTKMTNMDVVAVYVKEGDYVEEGTIICEFDASDYAEELAKAQNNYSVNQQIENLEDDYTTVYEETIADAEEGLQNVKDARDAAKAAYDNAAEALEAAAADVEAKREVLNTLKDENAGYQTDTSLTDEQKRAIENAITAANTAYEAAKQAWENAAKAVEDTKTAYDQAQSEREKYQETYEATVEKAQYDYDKAALEEQLISESQEEKTISEYSELIEDCVVRANMSGVITSLNVTEGNVFEGGDVYTIQDNEHFIVSSSVDEYDISSIEKGMTAYIKTDATGDVEMTGEVTYVAIASTGNGAMGAISSSASYTIEVTIDDPDENLRAGMTAKISIALEESKDALTVPYDAVTTAPDGTSTITVDIDGEPKTITVETGLETDYYTEIISDEISEGMTVYLETPMAMSGTGDSSGENENSLGGLLNGITGGGNGGGGDMPGGGGGRNDGGGNGGGGMPGGGPGGF